MERIDVFAVFSERLKQAQPCMWIGKTLCQVIAVRHPEDGFIFLFCQSCHNAPLTRETPDFLVLSSYPMTTDAKLKLLVGVLQSRGVPCIARMPAAQSSGRRRG